MQRSPIVLLFTLVLVVNAHFQLNYPQTRGFDEEEESDFCGGFGLASYRPPFPLAGGFIFITSEHPRAQISFMVSFDSDPTSFGNFNKTPSGQTIPLLLPSTDMNAQGDGCLPVNISSLGVSDARDGANATIQVEFNGPDGVLFQCADVVLSSTFKTANGTRCHNATGAFNSTSSTGSPSSPSSAVVVSMAAGSTALLAAFLGVLALLV